MRVYLSSTSFIFIFTVGDSNRVHLEVIVSETVTDGVNLSISNTGSNIHNYGLSIDVFIFDLVVKVKIKVMHILTEYSGNGNR